MRVAQPMTVASEMPLRLWPGIAAVVLQWLLRFAVPVFVPGAGMFALIGSLVLGLVILVWWGFFSRAPLLERLGAILLIVATSLALHPILHPSIATGMMGMMFAIYAIPVVSLGMVGWAMASRSLSYRGRRAWLVAVVLLACGVWGLLRTDGMDGDGSAHFAWRWSKTHEEQLLARIADQPAVFAPPVATETREKAAAPAAPKEAAEVSPVPAAMETRRVADWPGFRGLRRDSIVRGVKINTDWAASPPVVLWRRPIGPGWSSFAVDGDLLYTQEQRGDHEVVACYRVSDGQPVWLHRDDARFWESNAGPGPRGTPTISDGRVYTLGATGIVNALDARSGSVVWSRNAASDTGAKVPGWGFSSSPLVIDDVVVVATAGRLIAYDARTGTRRWSGESSGGSYSSPHFATIGGIAQVLLLSGTGATSVSASDGKLLWKHNWQGSPILQPAFTGDTDILISTSDASGGMGTRRIKVARAGNGWSVEERWTSAGLKPYFSDFVVHKGHAFGVDGRILACIDLEDGKRKWKGGRYGQGQMLLLGDQDLLLVLSEEGELALVRATPDEFTEVARIPGIEGKTWNHPVLVGDVLLARNGEEMAAFRLARAGH